MRPLEFYRLGQRLAESASTEVERRTVVSRLYYGLLAALEDFSPGEAPDGCDCPTARV